MSFIPRHDNDVPNDNITGIAISNKFILIVSTVGFGLLGLVVYFMVLRRLASADESAERQERERRDAYGERLDRADAATLNRAQRRARAKSRMRTARRRRGDGGGAAPGEDGAAREDDGEDGDGRRGAADARGGRKERDRAAKAQERQDRKAYAEEARRWREERPATGQAGGGGRQGEGRGAAAPDEEVTVSLEEIFPRREKDDDPLSEFLFWDPIMTMIQRGASSEDDMIASALQAPKVTLRAFIARLKRDGAVSVAGLVEEFGGISIPDALTELEHVNQRHGVVGIVDGAGNFVYVSLEMIQTAINTGQSAGILPCPVRSHRDYPCAPSAQCSA